MIVWLNACPMCNVPVTLGGGSWIEKLGRAGSSVGACASAAAQTEPQRASMAAGSNDLASSVMMAKREGTQGRRGRRALRRRA